MNYKSMLLQLLNDMRKLKLIFLYLQQRDLSKDDPKKKSSNNNKKYCK